MEPISISLSLFVLMEEVNHNIYIYRLLRLVLLLKTLVLRSFFFFYFFFPVYGVKCHGSAN